MHRVIIDIDMYAHRHMDSTHLHNYVVVQSGGNLYLNH